MSLFIRVNLVIAFLGKKKLWKVRLKLRLSGDIENGEQVKVAYTKGYEGVNMDDGQNASQMVTGLGLVDKGKVKVLGTANFLVDLVFLVRKGTSSHSDGAFMKISVQLI